MRFRVAGLTICVLLFTVAVVTAAPAPQPLFWAPFDYSLNAEYGGGEWQAHQGGQVSLGPGRFGQAMVMGSTGKLSYAAPGNLNVSTGTVEFWVLPTWLGTANTRPVFFAFTTDKGGYLNLNIVPDNRLGVAVRNDKGKDFVWRRVDTVVTKWQAKDWHFVAATWSPRELHLYVDGKEVPKPVTDSAPIEGQAASFTVGSPAVTMDQLKIFGVMLTPAQIAAEAAAKPGPATARYLSTLQPASRQPDWVEVGDSFQPAQDEARLPLVMRGREYARGIGVTTPATVTYHPEADYARLEGVVGVSDLSQAPGQVVFQVSDGNRVLFTSQPLQRGDTPKPLQLDISGAKDLTLTARPETGAGGQMAVWGQMQLVTEGGKALPVAVHPVSPQRMQFAVMKRDAGQFSFKLPPAPKGYVIYAKYLEDELNPQVAPAGPAWPQEMEAFGAPGEYEPVDLLLCAARDLPEVQVSCSDLTSGAGTVPAASVKLRLVARAPVRKGYWMKLEPQNFAIISRFAFPNHPFSLAAGTCREILATVHIPGETAPGVYRGALTVSASEATKIPIRLTVMPIRLARPSKQYGMYYNMPAVINDRKQLNAELTDMRRHELTVLFPELGVNVLKQGDHIVLDYSELRQALTAMRAHGFHGPIPVLDNLIKLARLMGHKAVAGQPLDQTIETDPAFMSEAKQQMDGLLTVQHDFPEFELLITHMDEVFNNNRLPLFLQFARIAKQLSPLRFYITLNTSPHLPWQKMMAQVAPYVNVPCFNGHALDDYLRAGGTFDQLRQLLTANKMEGWMYYNIRGSFFTPEWERIINGLYIWQSPLKVHMPWMYYSYGGDPFDDTDSPHHDFAYAAPSRNDPTVMVPTLHYECMRQGIDDMRYLHTLQTLIEKVQANDPAAAAAGQKVIAGIKARLPKIPQDLKNVEGESPDLILISQRFSGADFQEMRRQLADQIMKLQALAGD